MAIYNIDGSEILVGGGGTGGGSYGGYQPYSFYEAIGDSLTYSGYPQKVGTILQIPNVINHSVNGAQIIGDGQMIKQANDVAESCDLCTIMGGTNDSIKINSGNIGTIGTKDLTTFLGSYQSIIETLYEKNSKMRIFLLYPPRRFDTDDFSYLEIIKDCINKLHEFYSIPIINIPDNLGVNEITCTTYVNADKLHFSQDGVSAMATYVSHQIMAG